MADVEAETLSSHDPSLPTSASCACPVGRKKTAVWLAITAATAIVCARLPLTSGDVAQTSAIATLTASEENSSPRTPARSGEAATRFCRDLLVAAERKLAGVDAIKAVFHKRERVGGTLQELNVIDLTVRRSPASAHLRWRTPNEGREITWHENLHEGQMVVRAGGWRSKIIPILKVDPLGERALQYSRRPVTGIGLWSFNARLMKFLDEDLASRPATVSASEEVVSGRPCWCFRFQQTTFVEGATWQRVAIYVDRELGVPIALEKFAWPKGGVGEAPLEESYAFNELELGVNVADAQFDLLAPATVARADTR